MRHHILPMFESGKRGSVGKDGLVYKELKLTEQLNSELLSVRKQVDSLIEELETKT